MTEDLPYSNRLDAQNPQDYVKAYNKADGVVEESTVRGKLEAIDDSRWYNTLDHAHTHIANTDLGGMETVSELYSDDFLEWVGVFGLCEDITTLEDLTGISPKHD